MIVLNIDPPQRTREAATFNGDAKALLISADKARGDAWLFRTVADLLRLGQFGSSVTKAQADNAIDAMRALAHQFDMAADGRDPQAP